MQNTSSPLRNRVSDNDAHAYFPESENNNNGVFLFLSWNVEGLKNKMQNESFINYVSKFDCVGLVETWCNEGESFDLPGFQMFSKTNVRQNSRGRVTGGIAVYIKIDSKINAVQLQGVSKGILWVRLQMKGVSKPFNLIFGEIYNQPETSDYRNDFFF